MGAEEYNHAPEEELTMRPQLSRIMNVETFNRGILRENRHPNEVDGEMPDYLDDKNAAGYAFEKKPNFQHANYLFQLFCVEILKRDFSKNLIGSYDASDKAHYGNYMSCNALTRDDRYTCHPILKCDCNIRGLTNKECALAQHNPSRLHVGRVDDKSKSPSYSFPGKTECREHEDVGTKRSDGTICTWKRMNHFRLLLKKQGKMTSEQIEHALHSVPLKSWQCSELAHKAAPVEHFVV